MSNEAKAPPPARTLREAIGAGINHLRNLFQDKPWPATVMMLICFAISGAWIYCAAEPSDAGRGGAIAVGLSLFILFFFNNPGLRDFRILTIAVPKIKKVVNELDETPPADRDKLPTEDRVKALEVRLEKVCKAFVDCQKTNESAQLWVNVQMVASGFVGTLAWGFGDLLA